MKKIFILIHLFFIQGVVADPIKATQENNKEKIKQLVEQKADLSVIDQYGRTALHLASSLNHLDILKMLVAGQEVSLINKTDYNGKTALHYGSYQGNHDVVRALIAVEGIDLNARDNNGHTALHFASWNNHLPVTRLLIEAGADAHIKDSFGQTAAQLAEKYGHTKIVEYFKNN